MGETVVHDPEAKELYDRAQQVAGFDGAGASRTELKNELVEAAFQAARAGASLLVDPNLILRISGFDPIEAETPEEDKGEAAEDPKDEPGDDRTREPEREGEGPTSQPGPPGDPTGPSETPSHPSPSAP